MRLEFFNEVYDIVEQIPAGKVTSYGQIARILGRPRGARLVGWAMRAAPGERKLPCHRVVSKEGKLAPGDAFGGAGIQRELLTVEGVSFLDGDRVDMSKHMWMEL